MRFSTSIVCCTRLPVRKEQLGPQRGQKQTQSIGAHALQRRLGRPGRAWQPLGRRGSGRLAVRVLKELLQHRHGGRHARGDARRRAITTPHMRLVVVVVVVLLLLLLLLLLLAQGYLAGRHSPVVPRQAGQGGLGRPQPWLQRERHCQPAPVLLLLLLLLLLLELELELVVELVVVVVVVWVVVLLLLLLLLLQGHGRHGGLRVSQCRHAAADDTH